MSSVARETDTPIHGLFSPEGVRLELPIAGPAPRMFAYGIDLCIIIALFIFMILRADGDFADRHFARQMDACGVS